MASNLRKRLKHTVDGTQVKIVGELERVEYYSFIKEGNNYEQEVNRSTLLDMVSRSEFDGDNTTTIYI